MQIKLLPNERNIAVANIPVSDFSLDNGIKLQMELLSNRGQILDRQYLEIGISNLPNFVVDGKEISVFEYLRQKILLSLGLQQDPDQTPTAPEPLPDPMANYLKKDEASAIRFRYTPTPENSLITAENLQSALDQTIAILTQQQTQIAVMRAAAKQPLVSDTFTALLNTSLDTQTPTVSQGSKWVEQVGDWAIANNQVGSNGTAGSLAWIESKASDSVLIESDVIFADSLVPQGLVFRFASITSYWRAVYSKSSAKWLLNEISGIQTYIRAAAGATITFGQVYKLKVILEGNNINFYVNDEPTLTWTSTVNTSATKHGLYASSSSVKFDNFKVIPLA